MHNIRIHSRTHAPIHPRTLIHRTVILCVHQMTFYTYAKVTIKNQITKMLLNNYFRALNHNPICRLKNTRAALSSKAQKLFSQMSTLFSAHKVWANAIRTKKGVNTQQTYENPHMPCTCTLKQTHAYTLAHTLAHTNKHTNLQHTLHTQTHEHVMRNGRQDNFVNELIFVRSLTRVTRRCASGTKSCKMSHAFQNFGSFWKICIFTKVCTYAQIHCNAEQL